MYSVPSAFKERSKLTIRETILGKRRSRRELPWRRRASGNPSNRGRMRVLSTNASPHDDPSSSTMNFAPDFFFLPERRCHCVHLEKDSAALLLWGRCQNCQLKRIASN
ncbi:hypothetical protein TNIN_343231 [Trichonephila inaurata madagascariensis]|uniref:Uncharacterized protein n=1 Tax=Trichonephila inaurata madagascariensis TaxID=2747483 RepID=A0A8X7C0A6_9ARAC|nr:hypothetical protein TNIN_343231 [Trichonephila inaurata madagascariensis]